jgi:hypothetical protein
VNGHGIFSIRESKKPGKATPGIVGGFGKRCRRYGEGLATRRFAFATAFKVSGSRRKQALNIRLIAFQPNQDGRRQLSL